MAKSSVLNILKSSIGVSLATLLSRILGLVRTMLEAAVLGGEGIASQWGLAVVFPNIFRRLLGEGALGTALIPLISNAESEEAKAVVRRKLGVIFTVLGAILIIIVISVTLFAVFCGNLFSKEYIRNAFALLPYLMPYAFFICLIGVGGACLSTKRVFFLPALAGLLLNIFIISTLAYFQYRETPDIQYVLHQLSWAILLSGVIQLAIIGYLMHRNGIFPDFSFASFRENRGVLLELWQLALPGLIAGAALQCSLMTDRLIAVFVSESALPALTYSERIVYLPVGVFALAVGSVLMADMSRAAESNNMDELLEDLQFSLRHVIFCCVPMSIFVIFFRIELIEALFLRGRFTIHDMAETSWAMLFYCMGIPFFCLVKVLTPAFFARKDMKTPMKISMVCIAFNLIMNIILVFPMKQGGLALATVLSSVLNNALLLILLHRNNFKLNWHELGVTFAKTCIAGAAATAAAFTANKFISALPQNFSGRLTMVCILMAIFGLTFFAIGFIIRTQEVREFTSLLKRRGKKS